MRDKKEVAGEWDEDMETFVHVFDQEWQDYVRPLLLIKKKEISHPSPTLLSRYIEVDWHKLFRGPSMDITEGAKDTARYILKSSTWKDVALSCMLASAQVRLSGRCAGDVRDEWLGDPSRFLIELRDHINANHNFYWERLTTRQMPESLSLAPRKDWHMIYDIREIFIQDSIFTFSHWAVIFESNKDLPFESIYDTDNMKHRTEENANEV